jgi:hypothetical protein
VTQLEHVGLQLERTVGDLHDLKPVTIANFLHKKKQQKHAGLNFYYSKLWAFPAHKKTTNKITKNKQKTCSKIFITVSCWHFPPDL